MKPGIKPLIAGVALVVIGAFVVPASIILPLLLSDADGVQFLAPGRAECLVEAPARYYLWHDYQTVFEGTTYDRAVAIPDGLTISVSPSEGKALAIISSGSMSMTSGSEASQSIGYVDIPEAGIWTVEVAGDADSFVVSFAESKLLQMFGIIFVAAAVCLLLGGAGVIFVVIGIARLAQRESPEF
jgi:hypothetical protein